MAFKKNWGVWFFSGILLFSLTLISVRSYFTSQTQINNNSLSFGTLVMKLNDSHDSLTAIWNQDNLAPGDSVNGNFNVSNKGSLDAAALGLRFTNNNYNTANSPTLPNKLELNSFIYDNNQLIGAIETALTNHQATASSNGIKITARLNNGLTGLDSNHDNHLSLAELDNQELLIEKDTSLNGLDHETTATVGLGFYFVPGTNDNPYQGDSVVTNIQGTLYQVTP